MPHNPAHVVPGELQEIRPESPREHYLESILNGSGMIAIIALDTDFVVRYHNPSARKLLGYEASELDGRRLSQVSVLGLDDVERFGAMHQGLDSDGEYHYSLGYQLHGKNRQIECAISALYDHRQELHGFILNARDITRRAKQQERITRKAAEEQCLGVLLRLSLEDRDVESFLQQSLESLLQSIPWLNLLPKGAVFLGESHRQQKTLRLVASYHLTDAVTQTCERISFGWCICGRAAARKELLYIPDTDDARHDVRYPGMEPHGHYAVPILSNRDILGVLTLYLPPGHGEKEGDKTFLRRVADVLSMGISKRRAEQTLAFQAQFDDLTALPNRSQMICHIDQALVRSRRHGHVGAVLFIDLDHFKNINDSLGHTVGDEVLRQVSSRLTNTLRKEDMVARWGGDEFVVLLTESGRQPRDVARQAQLVAEKIRDALSIAFVVGGYPLNVSTSIGVALFPDNNETTTEILQQADTAMYRAKAEGRNCVRFFLPVMQMLANERLVVEQDLRWALAQGELQLHYQPQVDASGCLVGAEVLLRCPDRKGGFHRVDLCIDVAETTGLILPVGEWVFREACQKLKAWTDSGVAGGLRHLCINISPKQFLQRDFVSLIQRIIDEAEVAPGCLVLEITENILIDAKTDAVETMDALKGIGIRIAMDDFGTGYSSLAYLTRLPLDILKIDRSFVTGISLDERNAAVVEALMAMARQLRLQVIAEGVENDDDLGFLILKGCEYFQGFYFSPPRPTSEFNAYLEQRSL
ncbi:EAL domain-containing protein [Sedimenticola hydrogenitrophicus]|uniref:sensor domain-containing protein n=1 Tax=Sedimenticola hydrogenitrophicus TaxID=2967975 RepID=UPI0021A3FC46|nr:EAL domain-containing protein [Sedimenticola hydrogenitrophicus]